MTDLTPPTPTPLEIYKAAMIEYRVWRGLMTPTPTPHDIYKAACAAATAKRDAACAIAYAEHNLALIAADAVLRADLYGKESK